MPVSPDKILIMKEFRDNGAIGALLDEYEKAIAELQSTIQEVTHVELNTIVDHETKDPACRSVQTILNHVIRAGYCYVIEIRRSKGEQLDFKNSEKLDTIKAFQEALDRMFEYNKNLFEDYPDINIEEHDNQKKVLVKWGQLYDVEQLFEHAIVHILRHRRQIERFLIKLR
jgi:uncharacterized damage-inducible protein DinB